METIQSIHEKALLCARDYRRAEAALLEILQRVDDRKVFRALGYPSLFAYAVQALKLSESQAYQFIGVARKSREIPQLKEAITLGALNISTARRIVSVITSANQQTWIEKAKTLPQRKLEMEIVKENPKAAVHEKIRAVADQRLELRVGISSELEKKIERIRDIVSQKTGKSCSLEEALEVMAECYLEKCDPIRKSGRALSLRKVEGSAITSFPVKSVGRKPLPSAVKHAVVARDQNQCTYVEPVRGRCSQSRWIQIHHVKAVVEGGANTVDNLKTLCFHHHRKVHTDSEHKRLY